ncbi:unnamed protein product, partial [Coregonus sp. 'balchen']
MSLPPQQKVIPYKSGGKHRAVAAMKEPTVQHVAASDVFYGGMGPPALESAHEVGEPGGHGSGVFNPEKGPQNRAHYQQTAPVQWMHKDPIQAPGWSQEAPGPMPTNPWGQNFGPYMGGLNNVRGQMAFPKGSHDGGAALQMGPAEKQAAGSMAQDRGLEWEQHGATAAIRQAQLQALQHGHKGVDLQAQNPHAPPSHPSMPPGTPCDPCPPKVTLDPMSPSSDAPLAAPRRSRRLSRDGLSPLGGPPSLTSWNQTSREVPQNGVVAGGEEGRMGEGQGATGGVIQSTRRRRRASKEINLETLAQKASEMELMPAAKFAKTSK